MASEERPTSDGLMEQHRLVGDCLQSLSPSSRPNTNSTMIVEAEQSEAPENVMNVTAAIDLSQIEMMDLTDASMEHDDHHQHNQQSTTNILTSSQTESTSSHCSFVSESVCNSVVVSTTQEQIKQHHNDMVMSNQDQETSTLNHPTTIDTPNSSTTANIPQEQINQIQPIISNDLIKQELVDSIIIEQLQQQQDDEVQRQPRKINGSQDLPAIRKSTRLRSRISNKTNNANSENDKAITELQISIDPNSIHQNNNNNRSNIEMFDEEEDDEDNGVEDDDNDDDDDQDFDGNDVDDDDDDDDEEFVLDNEQSSNSHSKKSRIKHDDQQVGSYLDDDDDDDDDNDDDDDEYDDYRPLKKRKLPYRRRKTSNSNNTTGKTSSKKTSASTMKSGGLTQKNQQIVRLQAIIYQMCRHEAIIKNLNEMLLKMNYYLLQDRSAQLINESQTPNNIEYSENGQSPKQCQIPQQMILNSIELLHSETNSKFNDHSTNIEENQISQENLSVNYGKILEKYVCKLQEKKEFEAKIDDDLDGKVFQRTHLGKLIKSKRKFSILDLIARDDTSCSEIADISNCTIKSLNDKKSNTTILSTTRCAVRSYFKTSVSKRKRINPNKQIAGPIQAAIASTGTGPAEDGDVEEKLKIYLPCPWPNCTYESKREWALNEHINLTHTGFKQFGCKVENCPATFFGSSELDNHMKKHHADVASKEFMVCTWPGCNSLFKSKLGLKAHVQVHKGENLIPCDWPGCSYMAKNKRQHENHTRKHTGDRPFQCDYQNCTARFRTNDSLRHHKKSHSEYRPFRCDWPGCEANFKTNRGLTIHRALHTGEKLFKCDWPDCEYASERKYHVDLHIYENHTHVKPYRCTWTGCDASFLRNDKLQNHLKIHRQEKPFKCIHSTCDKHFVEKGNMMKHYNNVHKRS